MHSYKNWKLLNESYIPGLNLGISHPQNLGLQSNVSLDEKKKANGDVVESDHEEKCACSDKSKKKKKKDSEDEVKFSKKKMKKKMKHMEDDDDDVNNVKVPDDHDDHDDDDREDDDKDDDLDHDDDKGEDDDDKDDLDHDDDDDKGEEDDDDDDDGGDDAPKFGFMKDKKSKKSKRKDESSFWEDISNNYRVPKEEIGTDEEFADSLKRQYGNPHVRFNGGVDRVDEDLLLSPEQQALIDAMPQPGEVGYAPMQRMGGGFSASEQPELSNFGYGESNYEESIEESADYEVLCKYFNEDVAYGLIAKKRKKS